MNIKKAVAVGLVIFSVSVGGIFLAGFLEKQENSSNSAPSSSEVSTAADESKQSTAQEVTVASSQKSYTPGEVASHNSKSDCWLVIGGNVYDVSKFISEHPGGAAVIEKYCGAADATNAFNTQDGEGGHSSTAKSMLATYQIGSVKQ
jgi:cytochrome b involved in lipid metabolism